MSPEDLRPDSFAQYPAEAQALAIRELPILRSLPLGFLALLLREVLDYDWKFPVERSELDDQFSYLHAKSAAELTALMQPFAALRLSPELARLDWVNDPAQFSEKLSAHLWATQQMEAFRKSSVEYVHGLSLARPPEKLAAPRVSIILLGQGVEKNEYPLFRKLRPHGVYFSKVAPDGGFAATLDFLAARARQHPAPFAHWYVDGGKAGSEPAGIASVSYSSLTPTRAILIDKMVRTMKPGGGGPEVLRSELARMKPSEAGLSDSGPDGILSRFKLALLTQGSGTQMFSTTFVQWTAREVLRRAQPVTLVARFSPRQREAIVLPPAQNAVINDPEASLIDADMGAYYTWINQQRLSGADDSRFLVWFEGRGEAFLSTPSARSARADDRPTAFPDLLRRLV